MTSSMPGAVSKKRKTCTRSEVLASQLNTSLLGRSRSSSRRRGIPFSSEDETASVVATSLSADDSELNDSPGRADVVMDCFNPDSDLLPKPGEDPVNVAKRSKKVIDQPKGVIYEHITRSDTNNTVCLSCKHCPKKWTFTEEEFKKRGSSTSNQMKHIKNRHSKYLKGNIAIGPMDAFVSKVSDIEKRLASNSHITDDLIREGFENFIIAEMEPFTLVESESFLTLLKLCIKCKRDNVFVPKADALRNGVMKRSDKMKEELKQVFANSDSVVHLCLDMWTSPNMFSFLAVTAHFIDSEWNLVERLLTFQDTTDHSGAGQAAIVKEHLDFFGLSERLGCLTMDNATNNDTLVVSLAGSMENFNCSGLSPKWDASHSRIRCLPHIINLAVQAFLKSFDNEHSSPNNDDNIPDSSSSILQRLRHIVKKLLSSPSQRKQFLGQCKLANVDELMLILDVKTRWNSTYHMIERAVKVRDGMNNWLRTDPEIG